jgi:hypothetical protein
MYSEPNRPQNNRDFSTYGESFPSYYWEIQLSEGLDPIKQFNSAILCLSQAWTWLSNAICHGFLCIFFKVI